MTSFAIRFCPAFFKNEYLLRILSGVALVFGGMSVFSGGQVLFGAEDVRAIAGDFIPFIVWFNFIAGFFYVIAAVGLFKRSAWAAYLALAITVATIFVFIVLGTVILSGEQFEPRTVGAMILRTGLWVSITCAASQNILNSSSTRLSGSKVKDDITT